jgi:16S rRNA C967 or C1407 C5-methylase (RsmB/RsmF family)
MPEASRLLLKLSQQLFATQAGLVQSPNSPGYLDRLQAQQAFLDCLTHPTPGHAAILWCVTKPNPAPFALEPVLPWQPEFVDRLSPKQQPGKHPLHDQGAFYCLDFSSVFAISPLLILPPSVPLIVDMCAAPGGKSIFAWRALQPQRLICNEVIGKRTAALIANLKRCQVQKAVVTRRDTQILAQEMPQAAQVVLVDAPCSGQSLIAKGGKAPGCFHPVTINKNASRQKRILANSAQLVAKQGYLVYMTCTYSPEENEQVVAWFLERFPQFQAVPVPHLQDYQSHLTEISCYRLFPQQGFGAGAFTILLQYRN